MIETSVMNKTCDPDSIRVQGFDPEFRVPGLVFVAGAGGHFKLSLLQVPTRAGVFFDGSFRSPFVSSSKNLVAFCFG